MKKFFLSVIQMSSAFALLMLVSCASEKTVTSSKVRSGLDQYNNGYEMEKGEHGMMQAGSEKVSQYNNMASNIGARDFSGKDYYKTNYRKKRWGGDSKYAAKQYGGNTDGSKFQHSPYYVDRNSRSRANGQYAPGNDAPFKTGSYTAASGNANERYAGDIKKGTSGYVTSRNKRAQPLIIEKEDYNKLRVSDTKRMLGR